jgi:hypothetical protein
VILVSRYLTGLDVEQVPEGGEDGC